MNPLCIKIFSAFFLSITFLCTSMDVAHRAIGSSGVTVKSPHFVPKFSRNAPLERACFQNNIPRVKQLLSDGYIPSEGLLELVIRRGNKEIVSLLLKSGAVVSPKRQPIVFKKRLQPKDFTIARLLVDNGIAVRFHNHKKNMAKLQGNDHTDDVQEKEYCAWMESYHEFYDDEKLRSDLRVSIERRMPHASFILYKFLHNRGVNLYLDLLQALDHAAKKNDIVLARKLLTHLPREGHFASLPLNELTRLLRIASRNKFSNLMQLLLKNIIEVMNIQKISVGDIISDGLEQGNDQSKSFCARCVVNFIKELTVKTRDTKSRFAYLPGDMRKSLMANFLESMPPR